MQENMMMDWLGRRKISQDIIKDFGVYWGKHHMFGECIVIPVLDQDGEFSFNKYRRDPMSDEKPKYIYDAGSKTKLYGAHKIKDEKTVLIVEGELDALVAWSANIPAVSGTGGAGTFLPEWGEIFKNKEIIVCFDNDHAGGNGMVNVLEVVPHARILFLPDRPGIKDLTDYVMNGGDIHALLKTSIRFSSLEDIRDHAKERASLYQSTHFHEAYIDKHTRPIVVPRERDPLIKDRVLRAKEYPIDSMLDFVHNNAMCLWHNEKTGSLHYYRKQNKVYCFGGCGKTFDAIDIYMKIHGCKFMEAVEKMQ